jgi:nicotinamide mononucleotide transporter
MKLFGICSLLATISAYIALAAQGLQRALDAKQPLLAGLTEALTRLQWPDNYAQQLEVFGFVAGVIGVFLVVKQNIWNWPIGIANVVCYAFFFFSPEVKHFANGWLQIIYIGYQIDGWYRWTRKDADKNVLPVSRATPMLWGISIATIVMVTAIMTPVLKHYDGSAPFWDALTAGISLAAQFLLNRKVLESWVLWIIVDVIYVPLYMFRPWFAGDPAALSYYPTSILYVIFLVLAVMGYREWRREIRVA